MRALAILTLPSLISFQNQQNIFEIKYPKKMSKNYEYNYSVKSQLLQLREKVNILEEENTLLKESLQELIRVNTQLTESIQEFNNENNQVQYQNQQIQEMTNTIQMLNNEVQKLRRENDMHTVDVSKKGENQGIDQRETQSLVNVIQELIQSFKNMQNRFQNQILQFQNNFQQYKKNCDLTFNKLQEEYRRKAENMEPVLHQLSRKDQNMTNIELRLAELERNKDQNKDNQLLIARKSKRAAVQQARKQQNIKRYEETIEEKNRMLDVYRGVLEKLKSKFKEKI